jgi:hypothetical protein
MKPRVLLFTVPVVALVFAALSPLAPIGASAEEESVIISPIGNRGTEFVVRPFQTIVLRWGWAACTRGLVRAFINALDETYVLENDQGEQQALQGRWTAVEKASPFPYDCMGGERNKGWVAHWEYAVKEPLPVGDYLLHSTVALKHPVTDGIDFDGDGSPDLYTEPLFDGDISIHVRDYQPTFVAYVPGAVEGYDWPIGDTITLSWGEHTLAATCEQRPDSPVGESRVLFEVWKDGYSIQAEDHIFMRDEDLDLTKDTVVADLAVTGFDLGAGTVSGVFDPVYSPSLRVWLYGGKGQVPEIIVGNNWTATFHPLPQGAWGAAAQSDTDGDGTSIEFQVPQVPVVISVSTEEDVLADDGFCTLREAIIAANENLPSGEAQGECPAGLDSMTDTIILANDGAYSLTINNVEDPEDDGISGDLDVFDNQAAVDLILEVEAGGSASISQGVGDRVLDILGAGAVIKGLTLTGGNVGDVGGGVRNTGALTLEASTISGNVGTGGGGTWSSGTLIMEDVIVSYNSANWGGGVVNRPEGTLTVRESIITRNTATEQGGGIVNRAGGTATVEASTISDNTAIDGGGIYNEGTLISDGDISGNSATDHGGGLHNVEGATAMIQNGGQIHGNTAGSGGGVSNWGTLTIGASYIYENQATAHVGGGIANYNPGVVTLDFGSSVHANSANEGGGGVYNDVGGVLDCRGYIGQNSAASGGGLRNLGLATLNACGIEMNSADDGGGIFNAVEGTLDVLAGNISLNSAAGGGGLRNFGQATLNGTWVDRNTATDVGAGILNTEGGTLSITDSALLANNATGEGDAVYSSVGSAGATNVTGSCIVGNGDTAVFSDALDWVQIVTGNWWGDPEGPSREGKGTIGDWVGAGFEFSPWLIEAPDFCGLE